MQEDKIKVTPNCTCLGCNLYKKVNNISNLAELLQCRDEYHRVRKSIMGYRMEQARRIIYSKLAQIKV